MHSTRRERAEKYTIHATPSRKLNGKYKTPNNNAEGRRMPRPNRNEEAKNDRSGNQESTQQLSQDETRGNQTSEWDKHAQEQLGRTENMRLKKNTGQPP